MKHLSLLVLFCLFAPATLCAQQLTHKDVKFKYKKGYVFVQKKEVLKLRYSIGYFYVSDLNTGEEMMYFRINDNETPSYFDDDYVKVLNAR